MDAKILLQEALYHIYHNQISNMRGLKTLARRLRKAMTVGVCPGDDLVDMGMVELHGADGSPARKSSWRGENGEWWTMTLDGCLLLHIFESEFLRLWQSYRQQRN